MGPESPSKGPRADPKDRVVYWDRFEDEASVRRRDADALAKVRSVLEVDQDNVIAMASLGQRSDAQNQRAEALEIYA